MPRKPIPKRDDPEESERFIKTAREVEADESPKKFERQFAKAVKPSKVKIGPT